MQTRPNTEPAGAPSAAAPPALTDVERYVLGTLPGCAQAAEQAWQCVRYVEGHAAYVCPGAHHDSDGCRLNETGYCGQPGPLGDAHRSAQSAMRASWLAWQALVEQMDRLAGRPIRGHIGIDPVGDARRGPDRDDDMTALARAVLDAEPGDDGQDAAVLVSRDQKRHDAVHPTLYNGRQF